MNTKIHIKKKNFHIEISFCFLALLCFLFIIDKNFNLLFSLLAILIHEISHLIMMYAFGEKTPKISFCAFELRLGMNTSYLPNHKRFFISLAGPLSNILMYITFFNINNDFANVNLIYGCFQLLPIYSLDGQNILSAVKLPPKILKIISIFFCFLLSSLGFYILMVSKYNFSILIISLLLMYYAIFKSDEA